MAVWLFWDLGTPYHRTALMLVIFSLGLASVQLLATQQRLFIAFVGLLMVPADRAHRHRHRQPWHWQLAGILMPAVHRAAGHGRGCSAARSTR